MLRGVGRCVSSEPSQPLDGTHSTLYRLLSAGRRRVFRGVATIAEEYSRVVAYKLPKQKTNNMSSLSDETYNSESPLLPPQLYTRRTSPLPLAILPNRSVAIFE
jgi:hypothetical protein